nr:MAG TPA: hypothetical protein [Caudoviricetes sp.]
MEKTEKILEQLEAEVKKAIEAVQAASEKLESAQKELAASPDDGALKKKVQGLTLAHKNAAEKAEAAQKALQDAQTENAKKIRIRCRSKTGKPSYFRAGLRFTPVDAEYEVTEEVAEILQNDPWLEVKTVK